jgi:hypothetical protein
MRKIATERKNNDKSKDPQIADVASGWLPKPVTYYRIAEGKLFSRSNNFLMEFLAIKKERERFLNDRKQLKYLTKNFEEETIGKRIFILYREIDACLEEKSNLNFHFPDFNRTIFDAEKEISINYFKSWTSIARDELLKRFEAIILNLKNHSQLFISIYIIERKSYIFEKIDDCSSRSTKIKRIIQTIKKEKIKGKLSRNKGIIKDEDPIIENEMGDYDNIFYSPGFKQRLLMIGMEFEINKLIRQAARELSVSCPQSSGISTKYAKTGLLRKNLFEYFFRHANWLQERMLSSPTAQKSPPLGDPLKKQKIIPCFNLQRGRSE